MRKFAPSCSSLLDSNTLVVEYAYDDQIDEEIRVNEVTINEKESIEFSEENFDQKWFWQRYCYFSKHDKVVFVVPEQYLRSIPSCEDIYFASEISGWGDATKSEEWRLSDIKKNKKTLPGIELEKDVLHNNFQFKFISSDGSWISPKENAPNKKTTSSNCVNFIYNSSKTGENYIQYRLGKNLLPNDKITISLSNGQSFNVDTLPFIETLKSDIQLGAITSTNSTTFRIFAPRAINARVAIFNKTDRCPKYFYMLIQQDGVWEISVEQNLDGHFYYFQVFSEKENNWAETKVIIDPYAKAINHEDDAGIILDEKRLAPTLDKFKPPKAKDITILEIHLRDVLAKTQRDISGNDRLTFTGLKKYIKNNKSYMRSLGINCVELQPVSEFDYKDPEEYHWGYMPNNWFSLSSAYASDPKNASQIKEFKELIKSFHEAGIAVILDVVYNHFGQNNSLAAIDEDYYFRHDNNGNLTNYSGCGNDIKTENYMVRKMITDSLEHILRTYNVDGFRFDLAELLEIDFLSEIQERLKSIKDSVILIAEPWSFRGNIGVSMNHLNYSVWNDEYREFVKSYVLGNGNSEGMRYFLCGGLDHRSKFPYQSINYVASHDDWTWIDSITENPNNDGSAPTKNDIRRTHLCAAIMMMSIGIPMIAQGQDFLFSKFGTRNTYDRPDLNALDYSLLKKNLKTHNFFKKLIKFRLSKKAEVLRLSETPKKTFFRFFSSQNCSACALVYNADNTFNNSKLIFAINPHTDSAFIDFKDFPIKRSRVIADEENFFMFSKKFYDDMDNTKLLMPPMSCRIFSMK